MLVARSLSQIPLDEGDLTSWFASGPQFTRMMNLIYTRVIDRPQQEYELIWIQLSAGNRYTYNVLE